MSVIDVFISYKREERHLAQRVQSALNEAGFVVGTDADIEPSMDFVDAIQAMVDTAKATIVLWTKASVESEWVKVEARRALKLHRMTPPASIYRGVLVETVDLPMDFETVNMLDFTKTGLDEQAVRAIVYDIQQKLSPTAKTGDEARGLSATFHEELQAFHTADQIDDVSAMLGFVENYPDSILSTLANNRIRGHQKVWPRLVRKTVTYGGLGTVCAAAGVAATLFTGGSSTMSPSITIEDLEALKSNYQTAQDNLQIFEDAAADDAAERTFLEQRVTDLQSQARTDAQRVEELLANISTLQSQAEEVQNTASESETRLQAVTAALEAETENLSAARVRAAALEDALETAQSNHTENEEELNERVSFLENGLSLTQAARDRALAEVEDLGADLRALQAERASLQTDLAEQQEQTGLRLASFSESHRQLIGALSMDELIHFIDQFGTGGGFCTEGPNQLQSKDRTLLAAGLVQEKNGTCSAGYNYGLEISNTGRTFARTFEYLLAESLGK